MHDLSNEHVKNDLDLSFKVTEVKLRSFWAQFGVYSPKLLAFVPYLENYVYIMNCYRELPPINHT